MKQTVYVTFDPQLKVFDLPFYAPFGKTEVREQYRRQFFHDPSKAYESFLDEKDLYCLGEFDELTGEIKGKLEYLFSIRDVLPPRKQTPVDDMNHKIDEILKRLTNGGRE